jgi:hypothetical protein
MKKLTLLFALCSFSIPSFSAIFRIGYAGAAVAGVDYAYTNIAGAMTAASAGDTIQLYQQFWSGSATITVTKPLKFIGFGHSLDRNPGLQVVSNGDVNTITFTFNTGSSGSVVIGAYCSSAFINTSNISILRSKFSNYCWVSTGISNINIGSCFFTSGNSISENGNATVSNLHIFNCAIGTSPWLPNSNGIFSNNVCYNNALNLGSFIVKNCIISSGCPSGSSNTYQYNLFANSCTATGTGNQFGVSMNNVFVNWNGGTIQVDSQLVLKVLSPAIGAGLNNSSSVTDAGIFGGETGEIYKLSGIPGIPAIYQIAVPGQQATTNPYSITVSVRSND